jgi:hypothetical protein
VPTLPPLPNVPEDPAELLVPALDGPPSLEPPAPCSEARGEEHANVERNTMAVTPRAIVI